MVEQGDLTNYKVYGIDEVGPIFTFSMKAHVYNGLASTRIIVRICLEYRDAVAFEFKERAWRAVSAKLGLNPTDPIDMRGNSVCSGNMKVAMHHDCHKKPRPNYNQRDRF